MQRTCHQTRPKLALDRTARSLDEDGHLRVEFSRISKANVCPYLGREIPNGAQLGLDPNRIYQLYRDPAELAKAASTFDGKPLLMHHMAITADEPARELWVGSVGTVTWEAPYLVTRPLTVWTAEAIDAIESEEQRELSAAYRYEAQMTPGYYAGKAYDGRMVNIRGNHVAIVAEGRAGPEVHVADELPLELKAMARELKLKNRKVVMGVLSALGITTIKRGQLMALDAELGEVPTSVGTSGMDAELTDEEKKKAEDECRAEKGMDAAAELSDEDKKMAYSKARDKKRGDRARDESARNNMQNRAGDAEVHHHIEEGSDDEIHLHHGDAAADPSDHRRDFRSGDSVTKDEMNAAVKAAADHARKQMVALAVAREAVQPVVGVVSLALDSADAVYKYALEHAKVDITGVHPSAYGGLFAAVVKRDPKPGARAAVAMDAATVALADIHQIWKRVPDTAQATH